MTIRIAESDDEIAACFPVMAELRPHLDADSFVPRIRRQMAAGYRLVYLKTGGDVAAVAGYRVLENLAWGRFLYVDDLVTDSARRSQGHGGRLLEWLAQQARESGCDELHLDSGFQRVDAHRFYEGHHLESTGLHFRIALEEG